MIKNAINKLRRGKSRHSRNPETECGKIEWIEKYGSRRLRRMIEEDIECDRTYLAERLAIERPGWRYSCDVPGKKVKPRDVPEGALKLLDKARRTSPDATLSGWEWTHLFSNLSGSFWEPRSTHVAISKFMGHEIVFGGPQNGGNNLD